MAEVTRVPLQPIAKGSLTKLWLGVIIAALIGAGIAWAGVPKGVEVDTITAGTGPHPTPESVVFIKYVGKLADGTEFDRSQNVPLPVPGIFPEGIPNRADGFVPGFNEALLKMQKGGKYEIFIPAEKGYGANPQPGSPIPPNADLVFEVELVDFMTEEDFQRRMSVLQQMMQQQGAAGQQPAPSQ